MATILGKTKMIIVLVLVETTFITSCISQNGFDDEKEVNDEVVVVDCIDGIFDGIYNYMELNNDLSKTSPAYCYYDRMGKVSVTCWVNSYFGLESYGYTNLVRTMHLQENGRESLQLRSIHLSVEALELLGGAYDLSRLGDCPNVRFLKIVSQPVGVSLSSMADHFPNLEVLYVWAGHYPDADDLLFAKKLPKLEMLFYDMYVPVKNLEDCVDELFCKGHLTRLAVVAEYNFEKMGTKTSCVDIPVCSSVDIGAKELLKIDVAELLRSINCHTLYLNCNGVIPCNLGNVQNVQRITVNLEIAKP